VAEIEIISSLRFLLIGHGLYLDPMAECSAYREGNSFSAGKSSHRHWRPGPPVSAFILLYASKNKALIQDYWHRIFNYQLITTNGYLLVALLFPLAAMAAIGISTFFDQSLAQFQIVPQVRNNWLMLFPYIVFTFLLSPLPEELGWRGYWLDGLRIKFNGLIASLLLGCVWACWHIPLFMIKGYPLQEFAGNRLGGQDARRGHRGRPQADRRRAARIVAGQDR